MERLVALCCPHVAEGGAPILRAARDGGEPGEGGTDAGGASLEWQVRCGAAADDALPPQRVALEELVQRDPTAVEIVLHPRGTTVERRAPGTRWHTTRGPVLLPYRPSRRWPGLDPRFPPRAGERLEARDLLVLADVAERGWHTVAGGARGASPGHAFSVGLFRSFDHPEVAILGLPAEEAAAAVDRLAARVRGGERLEHGAVSEGAVEGRLVTFRTIPARAFAEWLGYAVWYHDGARFPALQAIWSDAAGRFPWDAWFPREERVRQPVLFQPEPA